MASAAEQLTANMNFGSFQKATQLHKLIWFTLIALMVYRPGTYVPTSGSIREAFAAAVSQQSKRHPGHVQHVLGRRRAAHGRVPR